MMREPSSLPADSFSLGPLLIDRFTGGPFAENGYLVRCAVTGRSVVVDPGACAADVVRFLRQSGSELEAIYLTHAHLDHVEGIPLIRDLFQVPLHLHPADRMLYDRAEDQAFAFGLELAGPLPPPDHDISPGTALPVGDQALEVRFTPGHAPGHVILYSGDAGVALVGDVIFQRSIGRTDLPGGDFQELMASIRDEVLTLPDETQLLPGHGPETTVRQERFGNPFLISQAPGGFA